MNGRLPRSVARRMRSGSPSGANRLISAALSTGNVETELERSVISAQEGKARLIRRFFRKLISTIATTTGSGRRAIHHTSRPNSGPSNQGW